MIQSSPNALSMWCRSSCIASDSSWAEQRSGARVAGVCGVSELDWADCLGSLGGGESTVVGGDGARGMVCVELCSVEVGGAVGCR